MKFIDLPKRLLQKITFNEKKQKIVNIYLHENQISL